MNVLFAMQVVGSWNKCLQCRKLGKTVLHLQLMIRKNYNVEAWYHYMKIWSVLVLLLKTELSSLTKCLLI